MVPCRRARSTTSRKKSRSTQVVVGLCGNEIRSSFGLRQRGAIQVLQAGEESGGIRHGQHAGVALGHEHAVLVDGIGGIRRDHGVAGPDRRKEQVGECVFGADGDDGLLIGVERHAVVGLVAAGDFLAQPGDAPRLRIAVIARVARGFHQLVDHHSGRGSVGISHPQVDHIDLCRARLGPHLVDHGEDVRRQFLDAVEFLCIREH